MSPGDDRNRPRAGAASRVSGDDKATVTPTSDSDRVGALTPKEAMRLRELEATVQRGIATFVAVGTALAAIRDGRLYRATHATFEAYCSERWNLSHRHVNRLVEAAEVVTQLAPIGPAITNESQARAVAPILRELGPRVASSVVQLAASNGRLTGAGIRSAAEVVAQPATKPEPAPVPHVAHNSGEDDWYTPAQYLDAARRAMGSIDTDPASSEFAQTLVNAGTYYTANTNGLDKPWHGNVWLNPPYSSPLIRQFIPKLVDEFREGRATSAVVLVNNGTETTWCQLLLANASAVCFPRGRINYLDREGNPARKPLQGQLVVYLGPNPAAFAAVFTNFGQVVVYNHAAVTTAAVGGTR